MHEPDLLALFGHPLNDAGIRYLVVGSLGAMLYSEPRLTLDIDLAVALSDSELSALSRIFPQPDYYTPPLEVIAAENNRDSNAHFNIIHVPSGLKADFYPSQREPFFLWAWRNRKTIFHPQGDATFAPAEYIIVWKVVFFAEGGGEKHVRDIRSMLEVSGDAIDRSLLLSELDRRGLTQTFESMTTD